MTQSDAQLVQEILTGHKEAFALLVRRYERSVRAAALSIVKKPHVADDIAQEAFVRVWQQLPTLRNPKVFGPWLMKITRRCAIVQSQKTAVFKIFRQPRFAGRPREERPTRREKPTPAGDNPKTAEARATGRHASLFRPAYRPGFGKRRRPKRRNRDQTAFTGTQTPAKSFTGVRKMKPDKQIEQKLEQLADAVGRRDSFVDDVMTRIKNSPVQPSKTEKANIVLRRILMKQRTLQYTAAAVILMFMLFGGIKFWPSQNGQNSQWWLGPSSVWAGEILDSLDYIQTLVYRKQYIFVRQFGGSHVSGNWNRIYQTADKTRTELYYESTDEDTFGENSPNSRLESVTWNISAGDDLLYYQVYYELECYDTNVFKGGSFNQDPLEFLRFYINLLPQADRILDSKEFEGKECIGFEITADQYGDNPKEWIDRIWLDVQTKLPVRVEKHGRPITNRPAETMTYIEDRFEYYAEAPASSFGPIIPEGFIQAKSYEVQAARERKEKGEMIYAEVPDSLKNRIVQAFHAVETVSWQEYSLSEQKDSADYSKNVTLTKKQWCVDYYSHENLSRTEWFTPSAYNPNTNSFDFNTDTYALTQTVIDPMNQTYKIITHPAQSHPDNPMDRIIFLATMINKADEFYEHKTVDGVECLGFALSAKKYGTNPDTIKHFIWLDKAMLLPVRMEFHYQDINEDRKKIQDNFEWNVHIDKSVFEPRIPEGYKKSE